MIHIIKVQASAGKGIVYAVYSELETEDLKNKLDKQFAHEVGQGTTVTFLESFHFHDVSIKGKKVERIMVIE